MRRRIRRLRPPSVVCPLPLHRSGASAHAQTPDLVPHSITLRCNAPEASGALFPQERITAEEALVRPVQCVSMVTFKVFPTVEL